MTNNTVLFFVSHNNTIMRHKTLTRTGYQMQDRLSSLPKVLKFSTFNFLDTKDILNLGQVNKTYQNTVKSYSKPTLFYAVGIPIPTYTIKTFHSISSDRWGSGSTVRIYDYKEDRNKTDVKATLQPNNAILFNNFADAQRYVDFTQEKVHHDYNHGYYIPPEKPMTTAAIFVVMAYRSDQYKIKPFRQKLRHEEKTITFNGFTTCKGNLKPLFANFNGKLFDLRNSHNDDLEEIWDKACQLDAKPDLHQAALSGVKAILNQYFTFYACITRNHVGKVNNLLEMTNQCETLSELHDLINKQLNLAKQDLTINPDGHYMRLLNFTDKQLQLMQQLAKKDDLPQFFY